MRRIVREIQRESAVLVISDLHYGKHTSSFNPDVAGQRLNGVIERAGRIRELLSAYYLDKLIVCVLGDVNDGTEIYATQPHHQAISDVAQQAEEVAKLLAEFARGLKRIWRNIEFECVPGNHGRGGRLQHEAANWDRVAYSYMRLHLQPDKIAVNIGEGDDFFLRKITIRNHNYVIYHGHDIRSYASIPWYGILLRLSKWLSTRLAPFDVALLGHFHSWGQWQVNRLLMMTTGTLVTDDAWALQSLGWESSNRWWLFGVSDTRPVTWQFGIDLV